MKRTIQILVLLIILPGCALYHSRPVTDAVVTGKIDIGMSLKQVREVLGVPVGVAKQKDKENIKEVWTYREYYTNWNDCLLSPFALFIPVFLLPDPELQYIVFQDGELSGWGLRNPLYPDLTIDKKIENIEKR